MPGLIDGNPSIGKERVYGRTKFKSLSETSGKVASASSNSIGRYSKRLIESWEKMTAQKQPSIDLAAFDKSEKMMEIRNILRISANEGNVSTIISFESLGTTRETVYVITLLRKHGYTVDYGEDVIIVK